MFKWGDNVEPNESSVENSFHAEWFPAEPAQISSAPALVFLHGLLGSASNFRRIAKAFPGRNRLLYDQRGHGKSVKPRIGYAPENYAQDLKMILDQRGLEVVDLVGHSMGGRNAVCFAAQHPSRVRRLVVEDIGPDARPEAVEKIRQLLDRVPTPFSSKAVAREFFATQFPDATLGQYLYTNIVETRDGLYDWRFSKAAMLLTVKEGRSRDRWEEWRSLKMPTLLVRGSQTDELSEEVFLRCAQENALVELATIQESGHWVHFDQPEPFIEVVSRFING